MLRPVACEATGNRLSENEAKNVMGPNDITVLFTNPQHPYYFAITITILVKKQAMLTFLVIGSVHRFKEEVKRSISCNCLL